MKYITVCGNDNTEDVDVFDTAREALKALNYQWWKLTESEKKGR